MRTLPPILCALFAVARPAHSDLLETARVIALNYSQTLPDFVCTEVVRRYAAWSRGWRLTDTLVLKLDFAARKESYTLNDGRWPARHQRV
jgi:hypothetical protein